MFIFFQAGCHAYHINFVLSLGCEDIIIDNLSPDCLMSVLAWSSEPHGSPWVHRQALAYLTEEFLQVIVIIILSLLFCKHQFTCAILYLQPVAQHFLSTYGHVVVVVVLVYCVSFSQLPQSPEFTNN